MDKPPDLDPHESGRAAQISAVMLAIEQYLEAHPHASDSPTGVRQWWLSGVGEPVTEEVVQRALEQLERSGKIERRQPAHGVAVYGLIRNTSHSKDS